MQMSPGGCGMLQPSVKSHIYVDVYNLTHSPIIRTPVYSVITIIDTHSRNSHHIPCLPCFFYILICSVDKGKIVIYYLTD